MTGRDPATGLRVAIAHDYVTQRGGAERVVLALLRAFPRASLHTTLYDPAGTYPEYAEYEIHTSALNRVGALRTDHRRALPLLAPAIGRMPPIDADVVIASSSGWAHAFPTTGCRVVYCYSPARWLYQSERYLGARLSASPTGLALAALGPSLRRWDRRAARRADTYLAISREVQERIRATYDLDSTVVAAPHSMDPQAGQEEVPALADWADGYHLVVSRLLPYKNVTVAIDAFRALPGERLVIVGDGPMWEELTASAPGNVRLVRRLSDAQMRWVYAHAVRLVAPSHEDYGLTPLEAGMFGHPTLALRGGGYLDTILEGTTGLFFDEATPEAITAAIDAASGLSWDVDRVTAHAEGFSEAAFAERMREAVLRTVGAREHSNDLGHP